MKINIIITLVKWQDCLKGDISVKIIWKCENNMKITSEKQKDCRKQRNNNKITLVKWVDC